MLQVVKTYRFLCLFVLLMLYGLVKALNFSEGLMQHSDLFIALIMLASLLTIGQKESWIKYFVFFLLALEIAFIPLNGWFNEKVLLQIRYLIGTVFFLSMLIFCLSFTFKEKKVGVITLFGSLSGYVFMGYLFANLYMLTSAYDPNAFSILLKKDSTAIYYSFVIQSTLGLGDILPKSNIAELLTWIESLFGQCYMAVIIGQFVGDYVTDHRKQNEK